MRGETRVNKEGDHEAAEATLRRGRGVNDKKRGGNDSKVDNEGGKGNSGSGYKDRSDGGNGGDGEDGGSDDVKRRQRQRGQQQQI